MTPSDASRESRAQVVPRWFPGGSFLRLTRVVPSPPLPSGGNHPQVVPGNHTICGNHPTRRNDTTPHDERPHTMTDTTPTQNRETAWSDAGEDESVSGAYRRLAAVEAERDRARDLAAHLEQALDEALHLAIPAVCPECSTGKCRNCDGTAWDDTTDAPTTCKCDHEWSPELDSDKAHERRTLAREDRWQLNHGNDGESRGYPSRSDSDG